MKQSFYLAVLMMLFSGQACWALNIVPSNSDTYYRLGGGSDLSMPPVTTQQSITIGGDLNTNLGFSCNAFNPAVSITNVFNNMEDSVEGLENEVITSATTAIGSLPMYALEKASPELYNLIQNTMTNAQDTFNLSTKSCQDSLNQIKSGKSPYQDWFSISDSQGWLVHAKAAEQGQAVDINAAVQDVTKDSGKYGTPWVHKGQNSGGSVGSQVPIQVVYDVVVAGYNSLISASRALDDKSAVPDDSQLYKYWKAPDDAGKWSQLVLGDITISTTANQSTHPGIGLTTILQTCPALATNDLTCANTLKTKLTAMVSSSTAPSADDLAAVSSGEMMLTPDLITTLHNMTTENQAVAVNKIAEDVAIQNLVDQALLLRRIIIAGSQTQPVHNLKPALTTVETTLKTLDQDIQNVMFEHNIRERLTTNTAQTVLNMNATNNAQSLAEHDKTQVPAVTQGAMYSDSQEQ